MDYPAINQLSDGTYVVGCCTRFVLRSQVALRVEERLTLTILSSDNYLSILAECGFSQINRHIILARVYTLHCMHCAATISLCQL